MAKWDLKKLSASNNNSMFNLFHHGDEVLVGTSKDGYVEMAIKIQTGMNEYRATLLTFETQSQCERLLPAILKGLRT